MKLAPIIFLLLSSQCFATLIPSSFDLWDVTNGTQITGSSNTWCYGYGEAFHSMPESMFGYEQNVPHGNDLIFEHRYRNFTHWVTWTTPEITVESMYVFLSHDGPAPSYGNSWYDAGAHGTKTLRFYVGNSPNPFLTIDFTNPYVNTMFGSNVVLCESDGYGNLALAIDTPTVNGTMWRMEAVQYGDWFQDLGGPRIQEVDVFATPEPNTMILMLIGIVTLSIRRRRHAFSNILRGNARC